MEAFRIKIKGIVQGVGFRPFVFNLARRCGLEGWVRNTSSGLEIEVQGGQGPITSFLNTLKSTPPPLAKIKDLQIEKVAPSAQEGFVIRKSLPQIDAFQPLSPDISTCQECLSELFDPQANFQAS